MFADLHLDTPFAWLGSDQSAARRRRQALRDTLSNIVGLAQSIGADALLSGGDLYEHERVTPDTAQFLRATFERIAPLPVFISPGNHDWYGPNSLYHRLAWSPNVHIFPESHFESVDLADGVTLWGVAHQAPANTPNLLSGFVVDRAGINLALFHGADLDWRDDESEAPHAPFHAEDVVRAGFRHAFVGHYHHRRAAEYYTYPGSPDPLTFAEIDAGGAVIATVESDGTIAREWRRVGVTELRDLTVDVSGAASLQDVRQRVAACLLDCRGVARVTITGELEPEVSLRLEDLNDLGHQLDALVIRADKLEVRYDLEALALEQTIKGEFVRDVRNAQMLTDDQRRRVLITGLRTLAGRDDLEVL